MARGPVGSVSCGHPLAAQAGTSLLAAGGNAVDAAVAAAYALMVVLPEACGLGGDAMFLVSRDGETRAFNGSGLSPKAFSGPLDTDGAATATVPGAVDALDRAARTFGRLPRTAHLQPAIALARDGFPLSEALAAAVGRQHHRLLRGAPDHELLDPALTVGTNLRLTTLARSLEALAEHGPEWFYRGPVPQAVERVAAAEGGLMCAADFAAHQTVEGPALSARRLGATIWASPPASQAVLTLMALGVLDEEPSTDPTDRVHLAIEAIEAAFAFRAVVADSQGISGLLAKQLVVDRIRAQHRGGPTQQTHTTTVTAADRSGTVVSMVISLYDEFGCATLVPEHGFFLNDRMLGFDEDQDSPNRARPSARPVHTLSPVLVDDGRRRFAVSTPGADGQVQTVTQVIDSILADGLSLPAAVDRPRWRSSDSVVVLETGFDPEVAHGLARRGHQLEWRPGRDKSFGAVVVAGYEIDSGTTFGVADLRREATTSVC